MLKLPQWPMVAPLSGLATLSPALVSAPSSAAARWKWGVFFGLLVTLRLVLSGGRDIVAVNAPHDEHWYVHAALQGVWGGHYSEMVLIHLPVYPLWLASLHALGVPARLAIDVVWLASAGYLAFALRGFSIGMRLVALAFAFLCFHPYALILFDRALPETLLAALSAIVMAAAIDLWNCRGAQGGIRHRFALVAYSGGFALAYHTRAEGVVLLAPLFALAALVWLAGRFRRLGGSEWHCQKFLVLAPLATTLAAGFLFSLVSYMSFGLFARDALGSAGYKNAIMALNRIDVGRTPRHVSVTTQARVLAYRESAAMRELMPYLEGSVGRQWEALSAPFIAAPGQIGNGWFYWALREAAARAGWHRNAQYAEQRYSALAEELDAAFEAGRLLSRPFAAIPFIDADFAKWLPAVPTALVGTLALVGRPVAQDLALPSENATPAQYGEFVRVTGRRNAQPIAEVEGWIILPAGTQIGLGSQQTGFLWTVLAGTTRADVPGAFPFRLVAPNGGQPMTLRVRAMDGSEGHVDLVALKQGQISRLSGGVSAALGIDRLVHGATVERTDLWLSHLSGRDVRVDALGVVCTIYAWIGQVFWIAALAALLLATLRRRVPGGVAVLAVAGIVVLARSVLFAVLDATSWNGLQVRYLFPVLPAFACMGIVGIALISEAIVTRPGTSEAEHG